MKKIIIILFFTMIILVGLNEKEKIIIPKNSIRFRVIANSNNKEDQKLKLSVKSDVEKELYKLLNNVDTVESARKVIAHNLNKVDEILKKYSVTYDISYGNNYFPIKNYKGINYKEGNYESLVITLGEGLGENWWCVLFPPLCLLDEDKNVDETNYELYAKKIINKIK